MVRFTLQLATKRFLKVSFGLAFLRFKVLIFHTEKLLLKLFQSFNFLLLIFLILLLNLLQKSLCSYCNLFSCFLAAFLYVFTFKNFDFSIYFFHLWFEFYIHFTEISLLFIVELAEEQLFTNFSELFLLLETLFNSILLTVFDLSLLAKTFSSKNSRSWAPSEDFVRYLHFDWSILNLRWEVTEQMSTLLINLWNLS